MVSYTETIASFIPSGTLWQDYDLYTNLGVPKGAIAEFRITNSNNAATSVVGIRINGSALNRYFPVHESEGGGQNGVVLRVKSDANGVIETYCDSTTGVLFYLLDYFTGVDFTELHQTIEPASQAGWRTLGLGAYGVPANAVCQCVMENTVATYYCDLGVRANGSALARTIRVHESEGASAAGVMYTNYVKADAGSSIQLYNQYLATPRDRFIFLEGYFGAEMDYQELWTSKNVTSDTVWAGFDLSADIDADGRVVNILMFNTATASVNTFGVRGGASTLSRTYPEHESEANGYSGGGCCAKTDAGGSIQLYASVAASNLTWLGGYFKYTEISTIAVSAALRFSQLLRSNNTKTFKQVNLKLHLKYLKHLEILLIIKLMYLNQ
jgi:hypothetical protein